MSSSTIQEWAHALLTPSPLGLVIAVFMAISIPILLHSFVFRTSGLVTLPSIVLIGPSGSGKTSLLTLFERGAHALTHTSQTPIAVECHLPIGTVARSNQYRSVNDPSNQVHKKFLLVDTPGHGKLRHHALQNITYPQNLKGLIFVVDAATLSPGDEGLRQTADYLHDVLLILQKRVGTKAAKTSRQISVLVAANKMDLFTALPVALVKSSLEGEITKVRVSRSKGLLDSGIGMDDPDDEKDDWLGEMGSKVFKFSQMEEFDIAIEVAGGNVIGDGPTVDKWWKWISERL
ncbi:signal recognition particle receptor beta subunit-domain-containing protein [Cadophora sp. MPI-SDFR-AT-0126]|nr:signal recognition particle receptor beta subunit-domain-containing protein [Leotiomycetes sp. MPI-SDFR-AT-0126]